MRKNKILSQLQQEESSEINISPLLDMVFILLIFFVVTSNFVRETGVDVKKPQASTAKSVKEKIIKVGISRQGTVHVFEKQVNFPTLESILKQERAKYSTLKAIVVADEGAKTGVLVKVLDKCNLAGIKDTTIAASSE